MAIALGLLVLFVALAVSSWAGWRVAGLLPAKQSPGQDGLVRASDRVSVYSLRVFLFCATFSIVFALFMPIEPAIRALFG